MKRRKSSRKIIEKARRRIARHAPAEVAGIVFDPFAKADLFDHFEIVVGALMDPLPFDEAVFFLEKSERSVSSAWIVSMARETDCLQG